MTATKAMQDLATRLIAGLLPHQMMDKTDKDHGGIWCPYHGEFHVRCAEAAFPMALLGKHPDQREWLDKGFHLGDWLVRKQNPDGGWYEGADKWDGTTVFQLMALAALLDTAGADISREREAAYRNALTMAAGWVCRNIRLRNVVVNYVAGGAAALALSDRLQPNPRWRRKARRLAFLAARRINREGFIVGEGSGKRIVKKIYIEPKGIDIGYGLEMTLAALSLYIRLTGEIRLLPAFDRALRAHLFFLYPDGSLDNSFGSRGYKWTIYGGKTSHGSQMALAFAGRKNPEAGQALSRTIAHLQTYLRENLLADGPFCNDEQGVSCLYPTAIKAVNLAFTLAYMPATNAGNIPPPAGPNNWTKAFRSLNSLRIQRDSWTGTVSGYGEKMPLSEPGGKKKYFFVPGGGSITYLFHQAWGAVQAATQLEYRRVETMHLPKVAAPPESLTPRVIIETETGQASSAHFRKPRLTFTEMHAATMVKVRGGFLFHQGKERKRMSGLEITYVWQKDFFSKTYELDLGNACRMLEIVEPVLLQPETTYVAEAAGIRLMKANQCLLIRAEGGGGEWCLQPLVQSYYPLPSLNGLPLRFRLTDPTENRYRLALTFQVSSG